MSKNIVVAKILTSHGVKGFVKLESYMEKPRDIFNYSDNLYDANNKKFKINFVGTAKPNIFITKVDGIDDMDVAKSYRNTELYMDMDLLPDAGEDEFYYNELIGLKARSTNGKSEGVVVGVDDFGAGTVVEIKWDGEKMEESLPFVDEYFKEIHRPISHRTYANLLLKNLFHLYKYNELSIKFQFLHQNASKFQKYLTTSRISILSLSKFLKISRLFCKNCFLWKSSVRNRSNIEEGYLVVDRPEYV